MRARLKNPAFTPEKFVDAMERNGLIQTAACLRTSIAIDLNSDRHLSVGDKYAKQ
jgi:hypothetical protein